MDEELDEDTDETQKNTKHNIQVGQYVEEEDSDTDSDNWNYRFGLNSYLICYQYKYQDFLIVYNR